MCPSRTICVPTWPKSSESLRILVLEKCPIEKSIIGVEQGGKVIVTGTRGTSQTDQKREVAVVFACRVGRGIAPAVRSVPSSSRGFGLSSISYVHGSNR